MIISFLMKTPDMCDRIVEENFPTPVTDEEFAEIERKKINLHSWFKHGEYLRIEYNVDNDTMTVIR